jgi:[ribosomal protein S18]-alanine N-acetyltransferase
MLRKTTIIGMAEHPSRWGVCTASASRFRYPATAIKRLSLMEVRPLTTADADAIAAWRYPGRYSTYDVHQIVSPALGYRAVGREAELVGYCCFGPSARVPEVDEEDGTLDVGYGMRPDLVGHGLGRAFVATILDFGMREFFPRRVRLLILRWNERSWKVAKALGFEEKGLVPSAEGDFLVLVRPTSNLGTTSLRPSDL